MYPSEKCKCWSAIDVNELHLYTQTYDLNICTVGVFYWQDSKVDIRLLEEGNSNSPGARPVHQVISKIKWI